MSDGHKAMLSYHTNNRYMLEYHGARSLLFFSFVLAIMLIFMRPWVADSLFHKEGAYEMCSLCSHLCGSLFFFLLVSFALLLDRCSALVDPSFFSSSTPSLHPAIL